MAVKNIIIVHHTGMRGSTFETVRNQHVFVNKWSAVGYQKVIQKNGKVFVGRDDWAIGSHTLNCNLRSLGVCLCGDFNVERLINHLQWTSLVDVVTDWCERFQIFPARTTIVGHKDMQKKKIIGGVIHDNTCPGVHLYPKLDQLIGEVSAKFWRARNPTKFTI